MSNSLNNPSLRVLGNLMLLLLPLALPLAATAQPQTALHASTGRTEPTLIDIVRKATERFRDLNVALAEGWVPATPCVSGPEAGAMGVHFALMPQPGQPDRIHDGMLNAGLP